MSAAPSRARHLFQAHPGLTPGANLLRAYGARFLQDPFCLALSIRQERSRFVSLTEKLSLAGGGARRGRLRATY
jgi:hypothetical protein